MTPSYKHKLIINTQILCHKLWRYEDFSVLLTAHMTQTFKCLQKHRLMIVVFNKSNGKYVQVFNPKVNHLNLPSLFNILHIEPITTNQQYRIFIHSHGIKGYKYDVLNYFTNNHFIQSISDKHIVIFTNTGSRLPFDLMTHKKYNNILQTQANIIDKIICDVSRYNNNIHLILSGFSKGCNANTHLLMFISHTSLKHINCLTIIAEAIPVVKYIISDIKTRYKNFQQTLHVIPKQCKVNLVLFPVDIKNLYLYKHHPTYATWQIIHAINQDRTIQQRLNQCLCIWFNTYHQQALAIKKHNSFVKFIPYDSFNMLGFNYCPQQRKIW